MWDGSRPEHFHSNAASLLIVLRRHQDSCGSQLASTCAMTELEQLRAENARLQAEIKRLNRGNGSGGEAGPPSANAAASAAAPSAREWDGEGHGLSRDQVARYSRQILLHSFGVHGESYPAGGSSLLGSTRGGADVLVWPSHHLHPPQRSHA